MLPPRLRSTTAGPCGAAGRTWRTRALEDPLTGLRDRRYLEERLSHELRRARRASAPLAVLMVDLDRFKRVDYQAKRDGRDRAVTASELAVPAAFGEAS